MEATTNNVRFPDNLVWKKRIEESGRKVEHVAKSIGVSREALSNTINGHKKGVNIIPALEKEFAIK